MSLYFLCSASYVFSLWNFYSKELTVTLIYKFIISKINNCTSASFVYLLNYSFAFSVCKIVLHVWFLRGATCKRDYILLNLKRLHWLPISFIMTYKLSYVTLKNHLFSIISDYLCVYQTFVIFALCGKKNSVCSLKAT